MVEAVNFSSQLFLYGNVMSPSSLLELIFWTKTNFIRTYMDLRDSKTIIFRTTDPKNFWKGMNCTVYAVVEPLYLTKQ